MSDFNFSYLALLTFLLLFTYISLRTQIDLVFTKKTKKSPSKELIDPFITSVIKDKAEVNINKVLLRSSNKPFGVMMGIPGFPVMVISSKLYQDFNRDELEYVVLHEAGHYKKMHTVKEGIVWVILILFGASILYLFRFQSSYFQLMISALLGLILGILNIQYAKSSEISADQFALRKMEDPGGMITASEKFQKEWGSRRRIRYLAFLFYRNLSFDKRIDLAQEELARRKAR